MTIAISPILPEHWEGVKRIYLDGITGGNATFEQSVPGWDEWDRHHRPDCRLVARLEPGGELCGWAALSPYSSRSVYAGVAEVSVYVAAAARRRGVGKSLLQRLILESESAGVWTLQAGIFPENLASLALHQSCGFTVVGRRQRIGQMKGVWRDVLLLERRSQRVGI